jgi:hypothetical protein
MQALLKILGLFAELIAVVVRRQAVDKREAEHDAIRKDAVGEFRSEFGGVPDNEAGHSVHSGKAGVEVDSKQ